MKIIKADYIYSDGEFLEGCGVVFDEMIIAVGPFEELCEEYPHALPLPFVPHSILYPGFVNTHVHLEFSANRTTLRYGSFVKWLSSLLTHRDELLRGCDTAMILEVCDQMLRSGITAFGAISSGGLELEAVAKAPQRVVFFNEILGSNPLYVDAIYENFLSRLESSSLHRESLVTPAIAIHSPYSLHPTLLKKATDLAKEQNLILSAHLLESPQEREWLENGTGEFQIFFKNLFNQERPNNTIEGFLSHFDGYPTHFTHCVHANKGELETLSLHRHTIAHCPRSNRYLGCGRLDIATLDELDIPYSVATDGLSSNDSLNIFDELRATLMLHSDENLPLLASKLIKNVTIEASKILRLKGGKLEAGYNSDMILITLPSEIQKGDDLALWTILHTKEVTQLYIKGEQYV